VLIRDSKPADLDALIAIYDAAKPIELRAAGVRQFVPFDEDPVAQESLEDFHIVVAEKDGEVVGFGGLNDGLIGWMFVHPDHHRQGIGRRVLRELLRRCPGEPWLWWLVGNKPAYALYASEGFEVKDGAWLLLYGERVMALKLVRRQPPHLSP
jgi:GNAT superfamily N-acetyltransferase